MKLTIVVGNPKPMSRTRMVAEAVAKACTAGVDDIDEVVVDLADLAPRLFDWGAEDVAALNDRLAGSDLAVIASPTFKATYTGLLKAFLDRYGNRGLAGVTAVPVMMGASAVHSLAPELGLRPLLVELGASVPTRSLYVTEAELEDLDAAVGSWAASEVPILTRTLGLGAAV
ncbi:MAG: NAD(P)H-dependent oxidoreductase [Actinomycetota bacterium]|nr:NAD(P)H-dependent oxidoreductase [Actinomycetota bacterium]